MGGSIAVSISPPLVQSVPNVLLQGALPNGLGNFSANVTLSGSGSTFVVNETRTLPSQTQAVNPMAIAWQYGQNLQSCGNCTAMGSSSNPLYVVLANPTSFPTGAFGNLALTYVALAAASGGATAASTAFTNTWNLFSSGGSPANVTTWSNAQLQYYPNGFSGNCALNPWLLLTTAPAGASATGLRTCWKRRSG
jgi:hypothetical protein